jgi:cytidine deaminase
MTERPILGNGAPSRRDAEPADAATLIAAARDAYDGAYAPYSTYQVGAAVLGDDGQIYTGVNVENAVYPLTMCAERVAIFKAVAAGVRTIGAVAVVTANGGSPCGSCRQVMREFGHVDLPVYIADTAGGCRARTLGELLPDSFSAADLGSNPAR